MLQHQGLVFVTGSTGFLGRHLVPQLIAQGFRLRLYVRPTSRLSVLQEPHTGQLPEQVELRFGDILDGPAVHQAMQGCRFVVHAAGLFRFWGTQVDFDPVNVLGTEQVAQAAVHAGVERLIHVSSLAVIGVPEPGEVITEASPCRPQDAYQKSKCEAEMVVRGLVQAADLPAIILRPGVFYGPGGRYGFNRLFIEDPLRGLRLEVNRGRRMIFPVYIKDVAGAICLALALKGSSPAQHGEVYNICDQPVSQHRINVLVSQLAGISEWRLNVPRWLLRSVARFLDRRARETGEEPFYPPNLRYYLFSDWLVSSDKARDQLGFKPTPLEKGLEGTIDWYREQGLLEKFRQEGLRGLLRRTAHGRTTQERTGF